MGLTLKIGFLLYDGTPVWIEVGEISKPEVAHKLLQEVLEWKRIIRFLSPGKITID